VGGLRGGYPMRGGEAPVDYMVRAPLPDPVPAPDCVSCARLAEWRAVARQNGEWSRASDCNIRMRRHPDHQVRIPR
jgi:hypothetical protein